MGTGSIDRVCFLGPGVGVTPQTKGGIYESFEATAAHSLHLENYIPAHRSLSKCPIVPRSNSALIGNICHPLHSITPKGKVISLSRSELLREEGAGHILTARAAQ